jgi:ribosome-associated toxin RatA of RatAB toxin-antitoxin module|tara:strand:- start:240 stop:674 length:435 start_codon:yes stop_codon:yes gene_type:complete
MTTSFEGSAIFHASPEKILNLINNFELYKEFLPGCIESSRLPCDEDGFVKGRLVFSLMSKTYSFESINKTHGFNVNISQSQGPFTDFSAMWSLELIDSNTTKVNFLSEFQLPFFLKIFAKKSLIEKIGTKFMQAFEEQLNAKKL